MSNDQWTCVPLSDGRRLPTCCPAAGVCPVAAEGCGVGDSIVECYLCHWITRIRNVTTNEIFFFFMSC